MRKDRCKLNICKKCEGSTIKTITTETSASKYLPIYVIIVFIISNITI